MPVVNYNQFPIFVAIITGLLLSAFFYRLHNQTNLPPVSSTSAAVAQNLPLSTHPSAIVTVSPSAGASEALPVSFSGSQWTSTESGRTLKLLRAKRDHRAVLPTRHPGNYVTKHVIAGKACVFMSSIRGKDDLEFQLGEREEDVQVLTQHISISPGDVIIDIGGNIGTFAVMLSIMYPEAIILSFEPMPETFAYLQHNLRVNNASNVFAYNAAVGVKDTTTTMFYLPRWPGGSAAVQRGRGVPVKVHVVAFATMIALHRIQHIRFLKIDCEGCEYDLLPTLPPKTADFICGEVHPTIAISFQFNVAKIKQIQSQLCDQHEQHPTWGYGTCMSGCNQTEFAAKIATVEGAAGSRTQKSETKA